MKGKHDNQAAMLQKLGITTLNAMQQAARDAITSRPEVVLLSPTGSGKTLAFLLPLLSQLDPALEQVQLLIVVPTRELAIQIEQVIRSLGSGLKTLAVYGGQSGAKDKQALQHPPAVLVGTPGRLADHLRRENFAVDQLHALVLDEFDKSLEIGFEEEMREILRALPALKKKVLTSATQKVEIPAFVRLKQPQQLNFLEESTNTLTLKAVVADGQDKLATLLQLLAQVGEGNGIIFCNFKDSIQEVSNFLSANHIGHTCFYGGLEQQDRERALIKFRNGTHRFLLATDLAARGIDVPEMDFIIHFELPQKEAEFIHRNGRTARMHSQGTAYLLLRQEKELPVFAQHAQLQQLETKNNIVNSPWATLYISGGRKDKISKGDIAGLFFKQGGLQKEELGIIELKQDCAFVAVPAAKAGKLSQLLNNSRLKKKKVRISPLD